MISILIPTRDRVLMLLDAINSHIGLADKPADIEFILAVDTDDSITLTSLNVFPQTKTVVIPRLGYGGMHTYYNEAARLARGDWLYLIGDDAQMKTQGWDSIINAYDHTKIVCLAGTQSASDNPCYPVISRRGYEAVGVVSTHYAVDVFVNRLYASIGTVVFPIPIGHQQKSVCGGSMGPSDLEILNQAVAECICAFASREQQGNKAAI